MHVKKQASKLYTVGLS